MNNNIGEKGKKNRDLGGKKTSQVLPQTQIFYAFQEFFLKKKTAYK